MSQENENLQKEKFIKAAKEHGCNENEIDFTNKLKKLANADTKKSKDKVTKPNEN